MTVAHLVQAPSEARWVHAPLYIAFLRCHGRALEPRQCLRELALSRIAAAYFVEARSNALGVHAPMRITVLLRGDRTFEPRQRRIELAQVYIAAAHEM
jgi:hypothetical protein